MHEPEIYVLADNIRSLYNVGSLFRLADAVGVRKLYLCGLTGAPHQTIRYRRQREQIAKTALAGLESVEWEYRENAVDLIKELKEQGVQIVALEQTAASQPYNMTSYASPICLILGHERDGVHSDLLDLIDIAVEIPMYGQGKSLNVISAASICLYSMRQQLLIK
jgi:23S rRNA (guanosine2251-2'-O)-methyltransferase